MAAIDILRKQWKEEASFRPFRPYLHIDDEGLSVGAGTLLAQMVRAPTGAPVLALDGEEERILALLTLAYRRPVPGTALKFIKRASMQWARSEKAIAHFELAYACLPRFETREEAWLLFYADGLAKRGVSPRAFMRRLGLDTRELDLLKYSADQPRVPGGNGRESGRWRAGGGGEQYAQNGRRPGWPRQFVPLGGNEGGGGGWRGTSGEGAAPAPMGEGAAATNPTPGTFSIHDWTGYPADLPKPQGPFKLLEGQEYDAARTAANNANRTLRESNPDAYAGKQIHELQPVKFGGSPTDKTNKITLSPRDHAAATTWWNELMRHFQWSNRK